MKIILDTDFLLHCLGAKVDIFSELKRICDFKYTVNILDKTIDELKGKKLEKLALGFIKKNINIIKTKKDKKVDDLILEQDNIIAATSDKELMERLKKRKIKIIILRQKKFLQFK